MTPWLLRQGNEDGRLSPALGGMLRFSAIGWALWPLGAVISGLVFLEFREASSFPRIIYSWYFLICSWCFLYNNAADAFILWWWFWKLGEQSLFCGMGQNKTRGVLPPGGSCCQKPPACSPWWAPALVCHQGFSLVPPWLSGKESACDPGNTRDVSLIPG